MDRRRLLRSLAPVVYVLTGCTGIDTGGTTTTAPPDEPEYDTYVFDHSDLDRAVLEGGIVFRNGTERERYVALLTDSDRFRLDHLGDADAGAAELVADTDFDAAVIVVC